MLPNFLSKISFQPGEFQTFLTKNLTAFSSDLINLLIKLGRGVNFILVSCVHYDFFHEEWTNYLIILFPLIVIWCITILAETNRTPFDFSEGWSELISGLNIDYRRTSFIRFYLSEYSRLISISLWTICKLVIVCYVLLTFKTDPFNRIFLAHKNDPVLPIPCSDLEHLTTFKSTK